MPDAWDFSKKPTRSTATAAAPLVTYLLCALCVILTLAWWTADSTKGTALFALGKIGDVSAEQIWEGRYYGLFTAFFLHGDILHIAFNMLWFLRLGSILEKTLSPLVYILFLAGAALVGSCAELAVDGQTGVGASGVVYAMFGLMWAGRGAFAEWRTVATQDNLKYFVVWGVFCLLATMGHFLHIANAAHGGGFVFGLGLGWVFFAPRRRPLWAIPLALLGAVCVLSLVWMPWSWSWNWWKGGQEMDKKHYPAAIAAYERALSTGGEPNALWFNIGLAWERIADAEAERNNPTAEKAALEKSEQALQKSKRTAEQEPTDKPDDATTTNPDDIIDKLRAKTAPHK